MSLADKLKKKNEEREVAGKHPLIAMGLSREVRDAYFRGVALAAFIDDGKVDDSERAYLHRVGLGLNLPDTEVRDMLDALAADCKSEDEQLSLLEEIASVITQPRVVKLFLAEFSMVWKSHASNTEDLSVYRQEIAKMLGVLIPEVFWQEFDAVFRDQDAAARAKRILDGFDQSTMVYLFPKYAQFCNASETAGRSISHSSSETAGMTTSCGTCIPKCPRGAIVRGESMSGGYQIILRNTGMNTSSVAAIVKEITGMSGSEARSIAMSGSRCLMTKLSYEKAVQYQKRFQSIGAAADVV